MDQTRFIFGVLIFASWALVGGLGCESDEFSDAPTVQAPEHSEPRAEQPAPQPSSDQQLPANHPPIDQPSEGSQGAAQARPSDQVGGGGQLPSGDQGASDAIDPENFGDVGPLRWEAPDEWRAVKPSSSMRLAQYHLPSEEGEPAELTVFYFGKGGGGSIQANIDRWVGQFQDQAREPVQTTKNVNGLDVHLVDAAGSFNPGTSMGGSGEPKQNWRLKGAIAETPTGNFFFKLTGPDETVEAHESGFDSFVSSFEAASGE